MATINYQTKLVSFDMDGTLIVNTNSVKYLCQLNGNLPQLQEIEELEKHNKIDWINADYEKAKLMKGLHIDKIEKNYLKSIKVIKNLKYVVDYLHQNKIKVILITAGPGQVANIISKKFNFDHVYSSEYEKINNKLTGNILRHLDSEGKARNVIKYTKENDIDLQACCAIGDSTSDIGIFSIVGNSIAINYSKSVLGKARQYIKTNNLKNIVKYFE